MVVGGAVSLATESVAGAAVSPGTGSSYAQLLQVTPHEGSLAVGAVFGEALAGHTNKIARAQSQGMDLGAVGASIKGFNCNMPPSALANFVPDPLEAETPSNGGTSQLTAGPSSNNSDGATENVLANGVPYGQATTTYTLPFSAPGNTFAVSGMVSQAWSGIKNGQREAGATADIGSIDIGGVVSLKGLHWEAVYPSGGTAQPTASFHIGQAVVAGTALPTGDATAAILAAANTVLSNIGIMVLAPSATRDSGIQFVAPLEIRVVPNAARDTVVDPVIAGVENGFVPGQPVTYHSIADGLENGFGSPEPAQLAQALCQSDTPITVLDITLASFTAGGFFNVALGGVNASSGALATNDFNLAALGFGNLTVPGSSQFIPGSPATAGTAGTPAVAGSPAAQAPPSAAPAVAPSHSSASPPTTQQPAASAVPASVVGTSAGGPLLGVGLGGLGLLALLAESDRRMMRRAQHTVNFEE